MKLKTRPGYLSKLGASLLVSVVALTAAACSSSEAGPTTEPVEGTHAVSHEFGETSVPDDLGRIVSLDEYAALGLLAVGITPDVVFTSWGSEIGQDILASAGTEVVTVPPLGAPPIEQVLAQDPGLVIFTSMGDRSYYDSLASTVPTVPVPAVTTPWRENLAFFGRAFDRQAVADKLTGALESKIADVSARSGGETNTVSVLMSSSGILATTTEQAPPSLLLAESGFGRPESQRANAAGGLPYAPLSDEAIPAQDARIVAVFDEGVYEFGKVAGVPGFSSLPAVQENRVAKVNGDMWLATHPFATFWMIEDMDAMAAGNLAGAGTESVAAKRYQDFTALTA